MLPGLDILREQLHRLPLSWAGRLVDDHLKPSILLPDLLPWEQMSPGGQNRGLEHGMSSRIEADELPPGSPVNHPRIDPGPWRSGVYAYDLQLSPGTGGFQHRTL